MLNDIDVLALLAALFICGTFALLGWLADKAAEIWPDLS